MYNGQCVAEYHELKYEDKLLKYIKMVLNSITSINIIEKLL